MSILDERKERVEVQKLAYKAEELKVQRLRLAKEARDLETEITYNTALTPVDGSFRDSLRLGYSGSHGKEHSRGPNEFALGNLGYAIDEAGAKVAVGISYAGMTIGDISLKGLNGLGVIGGLSLSGLAIGTKGIGFALGAISVSAGAFGYLVGRTFGIGIIGIGNNIQLGLNAAAIGLLKIGKGLKYYIGDIGFHTILIPYIAVPIGKLITPIINVIVPEGVRIQISRATEAIKDALPDEYPFVHQYPVIRKSTLRRRNAALALKYKQMAQFDDAAANMDIIVPPGVHAGDIIQVETSTGLMNVQVPDDLLPGDAFRISTRVTSAPPGALAEPLMLTAPPGGMPPDAETGYGGAYGGAFSPGGEGYGEGAV